MRSQEKKPRTSQQKRLQESKRAHKRAKKALKRLLEKEIQLDMKKILIPGHSKRFMRVSSKNHCHIKAHAGEIPVSVFHA